MGPRYYVTADQTAPDYTHRGFITLRNRVAPDPKGGDSFKKGGVPTPNVNKGFSGDEGQKVRQWWNETGLV